MIDTLIRVKRIRVIHTSISVTIPINYYGLINHRYVRDRDMSSQAPTSKKAEQVPYGLFLVLFVLSCSWHADRIFGTGNFPITSPTVPMIIGAAIGLAVGFLMWIDNKALLQKLIERQALSEQETPNPEVNKRPWSKEIITIAMIIFPILTGIIIWRQESLQLSSQAVKIIGMSCIVATALAAYLDMRSLMQTSSLPIKSNVTLSPPIGALLGMIVFWVLCFPLFFVGRRWHGGRNLILPGLIATVIFVAPSLKGYFQEPILPDVDSPEVIVLIIRSLEDSAEYQKQKDVIGPITVKQVKELKYDEKNQRRTASMKVVTMAGEEQLYFAIRWIDRSKGKYEVNFFAQQP